MKRTFGAILSVLGIVGLIYTGVMVIQQSGQVTTLVTVGIISLIFFFAGMGLVRNTADKAA